MASKIVRLILSLEVVVVRMLRRMRIHIHDVRKRFRSTDSPSADVERQHLRAEPSTSPSTCSIEVDQSERHTSIVDTNDRFSIYAVSSACLPNRWTAHPESTDVAIRDLARCIILALFILTSVGIVLLARPLIASVTTLNAEAEEESQSIAPDGGTDTWWWYHAHVAIKNYTSTEDLIRDSSITEMCHPLTHWAIQTRKTACPSTSENHDYQDLTLLYHMMCHVASEFSAMYPSEVTIVSPKMLNITEFRKSKNDPSAIIRPESRSNFDPSNLCLFAVIFPTSDSKGKRVHAPASPWPYESTIRGIPRGSFVHVSKQKKFDYEDLDDGTIEGDFTFEDARPGGEAWAAEPTPGECFLMANPDIIPETHFLTDILHTSTLIKGGHANDEKDSESLFFSRLHSAVTISYDNTSIKITDAQIPSINERYFENEKLKLKLDDSSTAMQFDLATNMLYGKWRPVDSERLAEEKKRSG
jgi:hypothetical protein